MEYKKVLQLRKDWANKPCTHPRLENEYCLGKPTGNKVCSVCGKAIYEIVGKKKDKK
jgi:hypothetical protein